MNKKKLWIIIGLVVLLIAGLAAGGWYAWQHRAVTPVAGGPGSDNGAGGDDSGNDLGDVPPAVAGSDAEFFSRNNAVNAAVLESLKPGGSGPRQEVRIDQTVALRGTIVTPDKVIEDGLVIIEYADQELGGRMGSRPVGTISKVVPYSSSAVPAGVTVVDFTGSCIYPGFVDMHNHVHYNAFDLWQPTFDIYPNRDVWPKDPRYSDWKKLNFYFGREGRNLTVEVTKFGEIRGLLCGETTMQGYNGDLPGFYGLTRGIENKSNLFGVDHINQTVMSVSMWYKGNRAEGARERLSTGFDSGKVKRYIIHLCEGIDDKIRQEFVQLKQFNLIREEIIGIHSTALRGGDWDDVAAARMKVVWSPLSNLILYNQTTDIAGALEHGVPLRNISFGPDWGPSGTPGMLYEAKIVAEYNEKKLNNLLTPQQIVEMMTVNGANVSGYSEFIGEIKPGLRADITIVKKGDGDPYESLLAAKLEDVNLVMVDGQPLYGTLEYYQQFAKGNDYEIFTMNGVEKAIDITEAGIDKGTQTLRELMELLLASFADIKKNMPFEFRRDRDAYSRLAPLYWPQPTSYLNLMYGSVLGQGSNQSTDGSRAFRDSAFYQDRDATAKEKYRELQARFKAERTAARAASNGSGGEEGGE